MLSTKNKSRNTNKVPKMYIVTAIITLTATKQPSSTHCQRWCYQSSILSRCPTVLYCRAKHKSILAELNFQCNRSMSTDSPYRAWNNHKAQSPKNQCKTISTEKKMSRALLSRHLCIHLRLRPNDSFVEDAVECRSHRLVR